MTKIASAFNYKIYRLSDQKIIDVDYTRLLPEKILTKMSKIEFRCYLKEVKKREMPLSQQEILLIKKIDKRIRNKETVRKSKKRFKEDFVFEKEQYEILYHKYQEVKQKNLEIIKLLEQCGHSNDTVCQLKDQMNNLNHNFVQFEI
ncbi:hypothetical protein KM1_004750 [Entamoeba histolytica HM-3:IMSS]|nr:hypothetical protein KM1_004750 [Entamoeba histolytica HM-3:IMSS]GAT92336.1 hypothetical protein CL6EHI_023250 [Entamoeba histolytica]